MAVGNLCLPTTTQEVSAQIVDANFIPGSTVPSLPLTLGGAEVSCTALDASIASGMRLVGAANVLGTALGDMAVALDVSCQ